MTVVLPPCYRCHEPITPRGECGCKDGIALVCGDCRDVLPLLEPGAFDLVLTDPPYGIAGSRGGQETMIDDRWRKDGKRKGKQSDYFKTSHWDKFIDPNWCRLSCECATVVAWFGHWRKRDQIEAAMLYKLRAEIIWMKDEHVGPPCPAAMQDERLWIFSRDGLHPRCFETTIWQERIIPTWAHRHHRNEKPESLMRRALKWLPGDRVLDPFAGSGTTGRACKDLGRRCLMVEIEPKYCEIAASRLEQGVLFT